MSNDQQIAFDWIAEEARLGVHSAAMPFKLARFRSVRDSLVRAGLVVKTTEGRYVPTGPTCG
jgi:hypothetical protein